MFRGRYEHSLDEKGRLMLPAPFKKTIRDLEPRCLIVTAHLSSPCLVGYPPEEWSRFEAQLAKLPQFEPSVMTVRRLYVGSAMECAVDKQGRVLIPPILRTHAELSSEQPIYWVGALRCLEIWSSASWVENVESARSEVDQSLLAKLGELGL